MRGKSAVVMIGLDACDAGLAEGFATSGHLPNLGRLFTSGARCRVRNPMGLFVGALWPTFSTGVRADRHGVHCWDEIDVASYKRRTSLPRRPGTIREPRAQIGSSPEPALFAKRSQLWL